MTAHVALVTDSTSNLPADLAADLHIYMAPLYVLWGEDSYKDGIDINEQTLFRRLNTAPDIPTTSQVSVQDFVEIFEQAQQAEQADEIVCAVLSRDLSGTYVSAMQAKEQVDFPVHIVDTRQISWALGFSMLAAAEARDRGASAAEIVAIIQDTAARSHLLFTIDSLEFLHRGGRIGNAARLVGSALNIKPLLELRDGIVETVDKVRTRKRAISRMIKVIQSQSNERGIARLAVIHGESESDAHDLLGQATEELTPGETYISYVTAVLAVHTGPGALGVIVEWDN